MLNINTVALISLNHDDSQQICFNLCHPWPWHEQSWHEKDWGSPSLWTREQLNGELVSMISLGQAHKLYRWEQFCKSHGKENGYSSGQYPTLLWEARFCCESAWHSSGTDCTNEMMGTDLPKCIVASRKDRRELHCWDWSTIYFG